MLLEQKIGQKLLAGFPGHEPPDYILEWLRTGRIGGVILFARNVQNPQQLARLTQACHNAAKTPILIGIDQEGGLVARLRYGFTESPGAMALGAAGSEELAEKVSQVLARELRALGINWDFAPVVDVTHDIANPSVSTRSLGGDPSVVSRLARAEVRGFQAEKVAACAKHFPGLGNTPMDTHDALAIITDPVEFLWANDLIPFRDVVQAGIATVMTTHVKFEALDSEYPTTLSPITIRKLLRDEIGYEGVVATDCMEMKAITDHFGAGESAVLAALADVDLILFSHTRENQAAAYEGLLEAVKSGRLPETQLDKSLARIQTLKQQYQMHDQPPLTVIRSPEHLRITREAARAGTVMLWNDAEVLPLDSMNGRRVGLIEFASYLDSDAIDRSGTTRFGTVLKEKMPGIDILYLRTLEPDEASIETARQLAQSLDVLLLATRSAHTLPAHLEIARELIPLCEKTILVCLRNPFDVDVLPRATAVLCTCGDAVPSLEAAAEAILGEFSPTGQLPVPIQAEV